MQIGLFEKKRIIRKTEWSWSDIERKYGKPFEPLTSAEAEVYIARAKHQMSTPTDIGTVNKKNKGEIMRKAYYKRMGWAYKPASILMLTFV